MELIRQNKELSLPVDNIGVLKRINAAYAEKLMELFVEKYNQLDIAYVDVDECGSFVSFEEDIFNNTSVALRYESEAGLVLEARSCGHSDDCLFSVHISPDSSLMALVPKGLTDVLRTASNSGKVQMIYLRAGVHAAAE